MINPIRGLSEKCSDFDEIWYVWLLKDCEYNDNIFFLNFNATPIIRQLLDIGSDYDEILHSLYLKDGEYSGYIYFSNFLCHAHN